MRGGASLARLLGCRPWVSPNPPAPSSSTLVQYYLHLILKCRRSSLQYVLEDAEVSTVLATEQHAERMQRLAAPLGASVHVVSGSGSA